MLRRDGGAARASGSPTSAWLPSAWLPSDCPEPGTFEAIYRALDASSQSLIGPAQPHLLAIPLHDDGGAVAGGFWGCTMFQWLRVQMLFIPGPLRGLGLGAALMTAAETEARARGCRGVQVDAFSFQAPGFYRRLGYSLFGVLEDFPPGHELMYFWKRL